MTKLPAKTIADAFALSRARGADLLVRLGSFGVWQGDLAAMRGDDPRNPGATDDPPPETPHRENLLDALVLARAIELLPPSCQAALATVYAEGKDLVLGETELTKCERRLRELYSTLSANAPGDATLPQWIQEREHAMAGGDRR